jgi:hypothetical protein
VPVQTRAVPRPGARRTARRSVRGSSPSCAVPRPESSPVVTPASEPPYLKCHGLLTGEHRAGRPPLPPSQRARPPTGTLSRPTTFDPSLGPAKAQAFVRRLGNVAAVDVKSAPHAKHSSESAKHSSRQASRTKLA